VASELVRRESHILRELLRGRSAESETKLQAPKLQAPEKIQTSSAKIERVTGDRPDDPRVVGLMESWIIGLVVSRHQFSFLI